jgi:hypothetical protein
MVEATLGYARENALADTINWKDTGCDLAPSCLACPFAECRYVSRVPIQQVRRAQRRDEVVALTNQGLSRRAIAERLKISPTLVSRYRVEAGAAVWRRKGPACV